MNLKIEILRQIRERRSVEVGGSDDMKVFGVLFNSLQYFKYLQVSRETRTLCCSGFFLYVSVLCIVLCTIVVKYPCVGCCFGSCVCVVFDSIYRAQCAPSFNKIIQTSLCIMRGLFYFLIRMKNMVYSCDKLVQLIYSTVYSINTLFWCVGGCGMFVVL